MDKAKATVFYGCTAQNPIVTGKFVYEPVHWIHGVLGALYVIGMYFLMFMSFFIAMFSLMTVGR